MTDKADKSFMEGAYSSPIEQTQVLHPISNLRRKILNTLFASQVLRRDQLPEEFLQRVLIEEFDSKRNLDQHFGLWVWGGHLDTSDSQVDKYSLTMGEKFYHTPFYHTRQYATDKCSGRLVEELDQNQEYTMLKRYSPLQNMSDTEIQNIVLAELLKKIRCGSYDSHSILLLNSYSIEKQRTNNKTGVMDALNESTEIRAALSPPITLYWNNDQMNVRGYATHIIIRNPGTPTQESFLLGTRELKKGDTIEIFR